jgi:hypothetical protein
MQSTGVAQTIGMKFRRAVGCVVVAKVGKTSLTLTTTAGSDETEGEAVVSLTQRETAQALTYELQRRLGAHVVSVPGSATITFQIMASEVDGTLERVRDLGFEPVFRNYGLRFTNRGALPCSTYEINLPADRQPISTERPHFEVSSSASKYSAEVTAFLKDWYGWPPKQK